MIKIIGICSSAPPCLTMHLIGGRKPPSGCLGASLHGIKLLENSEKAFFRCSLSGFPILASKQPLAISPAKLAEQVPRLSVCSVCVCVCIPVWIFLEPFVRLHKWQEKVKICLNSCLTQPHLGQLCPIQIRLHLLSALHSTGGTLPVLIRQPDLLSSFCLLLLLNLWTPYCLHKAGGPISAPLNSRQAQLLLLKCSTADFGNHAEV